MLMYKPVYAIENYKHQNYIIEDTGEILTGWPSRLEPKDFRFSAMHNGFLVVSFVPMYNPLPQSNVFKSQLLEWKDNNGFAPSGELKYMNRYYK